MILLALVIIGGLGGLIAHAEADRRAAYEFTDEGMWIVESGDTLWRIADFYSDNRHDTRKVIDIIITLNPELKINGRTQTIYPGQQIFVPLFECMDWEYYEGE